MRTLLPVLIALALFAPASADHCESYSTSQPEIDTHDALDPVGGGRYYADNELHPDWMPSTWIYEESNGILGLQRDDFFVDDTCHGLIQPDTLIF